jgi:hypothetical protein
MLAEVVVLPTVVVVQAVQVGLEEALLAATQVQALLYQMGLLIRVEVEVVMVMMLLILIQRVSAERAWSF